MARTPKDSLEAAKRLPGSSAKTRLRKLVCSDDCGYPPLRVSRTAIAAGLPTCVCGELLWPWDLDDVELAHASGHLTDEQRASHPLVVEYERQCNSVAKGQSWARGAAMQDPTAVAFLRVAQTVRQTNHDSQLAAARRRRAVEPMPF